MKNVAVTRAAFTTARAAVSRAKGEAFSQSIIQPPEKIHIQRKLHQVPYRQSLATPGGIDFAVITEH